MSTPVLSQAAHRAFEFVVAGEPVPCTMTMLMAFAELAEADCIAPDGPNLHRWVATPRGVLLTRTVKR